MVSSPSPSYTIDGNLMTDQLAAIMLVHSTLGLTKYGYFGKNLDALWDHLTEFARELAGKNEKVYLTVTNSTLVEQRVLEILQEIMEDDLEGAITPGANLIVTLQ